MHPEDIKAEIRKKGFFLYQIAHELGVDPSIVGNVIYRRRVSKRVQAAISRVLEKTVDEVFPETRGTTGEKT